MWDVQSHSITWRSRNDLEKGCLTQAAKTKKCSIFGTNDCSKIRTYTVLNTLFEECNFEIFELKYFKTLSQKDNV